MARKANTEGYRLSKKEKEKLRQREKAAKKTSGFSLNNVFAAIGGVVLSVIPQSRKSKTSTVSKSQGPSPQKKVHLLLYFFNTNDTTLYRRFTFVLRVCVLKGTS